MPPRRLPALRLSLIAAMLGAQLVAGGALAAAQTIEPQENSLNSAVDNFISYLKSETNETMTAAARIARENRDSLARAKSRIGAQIDAWRGSLSGQKARLTTLGTEASAMWEAWRETAGTSWAKVEHSARDALDWIAGWMRNQSLSDQRPETPV
jgi:outer membrane murein-binding lipoprotein Lpp